MTGRRSPPRFGSALSATAKPARRRCASGQELGSEMHSGDPRTFLGREFIAYVADAPENAVDEAIADPAHPLHETVHTALGECQAFLSAASFGIHERVAEIPAGRD